MAVIGLDGAVPDLAFERYADRMPTLSRLRAEGAWGRLRSIDPPITVPAWSCAMTGLSPGALGIYGFRNRRDHTYDRLVFSTSRAVTAPRVWERLSEEGRPSIVVGVPGTYPPKPIEGALVGCFLTPSIASDYTWPPELKAEIAAEVGPYILDVEDFRSDEKERVLAHVHEMTRTRFRLARHLTATRPWDFFMMVEIGGDRLQHAFWAYAHPDHRNYRPDPVLGPAIGDYYAMLDTELGELLGSLGPGVDVFVISDHGAQHMAGGFCINEWLRRQGYLRLEEEPTGPTPMTAAKVDWERTVAWADGGYYGRVFLNVAGREPLGCVPPERYEEMRAEIAAGLEAVVDHRGDPMGNRVHRPEDLYPVVNGIAPDLIAYFGDLRWRPVATMGLGLYTFENDTGPDDANHAMDGIFVAAGPRVPLRGEQCGAELMQIGPTVLGLYGLDPNPGTEVKPLW
ncbi:MAG TPA: alkaline phosphatase family protein [Acidimicrobiia bacterium]|nr:alkaline phosphatase family protein [Acidimicrobiia bacterium]